MKLLSQIPKSELAGKVVLLRAGLNVPLSKAQGDGVESNIVITDDTRIQRALPTIRYLAMYCKRLVIIAHIGRDSTESLAPVIVELQRHLQEYTNIQFMENLRQDPREVSNSEQERDAFAMEIVQGSGADIFVQDAFPVLHREHASTVALPKLLPSYAGFLIEREVEELSEALVPESPSLFILGGAKFETKGPLIRKFLEIYDKVFIAGAIANEFFESLGLEVGESLVSEGSSIPSEVLHHPSVVLPNKVVVVDSSTGKRSIVNPQELTSTMSIVDVLPPSDLLSAPSTVPAKFVLWNGPLGYYEGGFNQGTETLLAMLACNDEASIVTGGGDTLATIGTEQRNVFTHISSGGGAMLTYLQEGALVGLTALE